MSEITSSCLLQILIRKHQLPLSGSVLIFGFELVLFVRWQCMGQLGSQLQEHCVSCRQVQLCNDFHFQNRWIHLLTDTAGNNI